MLILGKDTDDTGAQLERLTLKILQSLGYRNIQTNVIGPGGQEIDVSANYPIALPTTSELRRTICECKAYQSPVGITDWLKFLGKIFSEQVRLGREVQGVFIALNSVNGNVAGAYDELKAHGNTVSLISGEELSTLLTQIYEIPQIQVIVKNFSTLTSKRYLSLELAYYNERLYWIFGLEANTFAILDVTGGLLSQDEQKNISVLALAKRSGDSCVDLSEEVEAKKRGTLVRKFIIGSAIARGGECQLADLLPNSFGYLEAELRAEITAIGNLGLNITVTASSVEMPSKSHNDFYKSLFRILHLLTDGTLKREVFDMVFGSKYVDECISKEMLVAISEIQHGLKFTDAVVDRALMLLKLSPSALLYASAPDPMIVTHRTHQPAVGGNMDEHDERTFFRSLTDNFLRDFNTHNLKSYFFHKRGVRESDVTRTLKVKNKEMVIVEVQTRDRKIIAEASAELGGGIIMAQGIDSAPEPWEWGRSSERGG